MAGGLTATCRISRRKENMCIRGFSILVLQVATYVAGNAQALSMLLQPASKRNLVVLFRTYMFERGTREKYALFSFLFLGLALVCLVEIVGQVWGYLPTLNLSAKMVIVLVLRKKKLPIFSFLLLKYSCIVQGG